MIGKLNFCQKHFITIYFPAFLSLSSYIRCLLMVLPLPFQSTLYNQTHAGEVCCTGMPIYKLHLPVKCSDCFIYFNEVNTVSKLNLHKDIYISACLLQSYHDLVLGNIVLSVLLQVSFQVSALLYLNFHGESILKLENKSLDQANKVKNTVIFNCFVFCQVIDLSPLCLVSQHHPVFDW